MKKIIITVASLLVLFGVSNTTYAQDDHEVEVGVRVQIRDTVTVPEEGDVENQFQLRRARVNIHGHVFDPHNRFKIQLGLSPRDMGLVDGTVTHTPLLDYYLDFTHLRDLSVMIGQYKVPFSRERIMSSGDLAWVDRSLVAGTLDIERDIGVTLHSQDFLGIDMIRYYLGVYSGLGRDGFLSQEVDEMQPLFIGRVELHPLGLFDSNDQIDFQRSEEVDIAVGFGYAYQGDIHRLTADAVAHFMGFGLEGAMITRANNVTSEVDFGYYVQLSSIIPETEYLGAAVRFGQVNPLEGAAIENQYELGGSLSYYFEEHKIKLQLDVFNHWDEEITIGEQQVRLHLQVGI